METEKVSFFENFEFGNGTKDFSSFGEAMNRPIVTNYDTSDYRYGRATHGHLPFKGPKPVFVVKGPDFNENVILEEGRLIDEAPTYARILGLTLNGADGSPIDALIRRKEQEQTL